MFGREREMDPPGGEEGAFQDDSWPQGGRNPAADVGIATTANRSRAPAAMTNGPGPRTGVRIRALTECDESRAATCQLAKATPTDCSGPTPEPPSRLAPEPPARGGVVLVPSPPHRLWGAGTVGVHLGSPGTENLALLGRCA